MITFDLCRLSTFTPFFLLFQWPACVNGHWLISHWNRSSKTANSFSCSFSIVAASSASFWNPLNDSAARVKLWLRNSSENSSFARHIETFGRHLRHHHTEASSERASWLKQPSYDAPSRDNNRIHEAAISLLLRRPPKRSLVIPTWFTSEEQFVLCTILTRFVESFNRV